MYIFKNAFKSITRSKGRNILIGFILVVISVSSCIALSIKNSASEIVNSYEQNFNLTATIGVDREALRAAAQTQGTDMRQIIQSITNPSIDDIKKYGDSKYLSGYSYILSSSVNSSTLTPVSNETASLTPGVTQSAANGANNNNNNNNNNSNNNPGRNPQDLPGGGQLTRGDFTIVGYSGVSAMTSFVNGTYKVTSGAMFEDTNKSTVCVISEELATENSVKINDKITLTNPKNAEEKYIFTVVGLYKDTTATDTSSMNWFSNAANQIITNYTALSAIVDSSKVASDKVIADAAAKTATTTATPTSAATATTAEPAATTLSSQLASSFNLIDNDSVAAFTAELKAKGLSDKYTVTTNIDALSQRVKPVKNLNNFATIFLILVLIIGGLILSVLNMINIRERKYEVGVLRAIGMKKGKLALQFVSELLMVTLVSIIIGSALGAMLSVPTASTLLKSEVTAMQTSQTQIAENFGRGGQGGFGGPGAPGGEAFGSRGGPGIMGGVFNQGRNVNYITQINAVINLQVLLQLVLIGLILTALSSIVSVVLISRYEPLKILSNRS